MRILVCAMVPLAMGAVLMTGCAPAASTDDSATQSTTEQTGTTPDALVGSYSIDYRTTESDRDVVTDEVVVRTAEVTGACAGSDCSFELTTEITSPDGGISSTTTALTFDGSTYVGSQSSAFDCDGMTSLTTVEGGLEYTSETTITPSSTTVEGGRDVITTFDVVIVEHNEITAAGREAGCPAINFAGPDPYVANFTTVGVGTRLDSE